MTIWACQWQKQIFLVDVHWRCAKTEPLFCSPFCGHWLQRSRSMLDHFQKLLAPLVTWTWKNEKLGSINTNDLTGISFFVFLKYSLKRTKHKPKQLYFSIFYGPNLKLVLRKIQKHTNTRTNNLEILVFTKSTSEFRFYYIWTKSLLK